MQNIMMNIIVNDLKGRYMKKKIFYSNEKVLKFINNKKVKIKSIQPIKKTLKRGIFQDTMIITSYCVNYEKMI